MTSRVVITGGAGFIGSNLTEALLERQYEVVGVDDLSAGRPSNIEPYVENPAYKFEKVDVRDLSALQTASRDAELIVHLAARKIPKYGEEISTLLVNEKGAENVLETARKHDLKVLLASSSDVYGKNPQLPYSEESDLVLGQTNIRRWSYAVSKIFDEHLCYAYAEAYGLKTVILRFFNSYGPKQDLTWRGGPQSVFIDAVIRDKEIEIHGDGSQTRCFTYISDLVAGIVAALENKEADGRAFNLGNTQEISILELARLIKKLSGTPSELKIRFVPHEKVFGRFEEVYHRIPDVSLARKVLGFSPKVGLEEGLMKTIEWQKTVTL